MKNDSYRWPTKLKKFGITNPFLKIIIAKYENEIPWQSKVRNEQELMAYVVNEMLPRQMDRIAYPPIQGKKNCYVSSREVDVDRAIEANGGLNQEEKQILILIRSEDGESEAKYALANLINDRKAVAFKKWCAFLSDKYPTNEIFGFLLLRPLLDLSGHGSRRLVVPPSSDVVDWLFRRISTEQFSPNENVASAYTRKLGSGAQLVPDNGWQYIPRGIFNAARLAAASQGSGWCIASYNCAEDYICESNFYILRHAGKPVVALRVTGDSVIECQGRGNSEPCDWFMDINFFIETQDFKLCHRCREMKWALESLTYNKDDAWWIERVKYWPFVLPLIPKTALPRDLNFNLFWLTPYMGFPSFFDLLDKSGLSLDDQSWADMVFANPPLYLELPSDKKSNKRFISACRAGFIARARDMEMTVYDFQAIPPIIRDDPELIEVIKEYFPVEIKTQIRRRASTANERLSPFILSERLPVSDADPFEIVLEHAINSLMTNNTSSFSDGIFSSVLRERRDFSRLRHDAWREAIEAEPPLWLALPGDLKDLPEFALTDGQVSRIDMASWEENVRKTPWLLTQAKGVPKSIRHHGQILDAYVKGWLPFFQKTPWQIWLKRGLRRVYASYGILNDHRVLEARVKGWEVFRKKEMLDKAWFKASERMRQSPDLQLSVLVLLGENLHRAKCIDPQDRETCNDIVRLQDRSLSIDQLNPVQREVRRRLVSMGFMN